MKVFIIGSGGREHAIALKLKESPSVEEIFIAPGNAGTAEIGTNVNIAADDVEKLTDFAIENGIDLAVAGQETPLCLGIADMIKKKACAAGKKIAFFGPPQKCAQLEGSKSFAKAMMEELNIPTAKYRSFSEYTEAEEYIKEIDYPFVIKADGLAAGKGVFLPSSKEEGLAVLKEIMLEQKCGGAGSRVVIEERLEGEEVSVLAFCDGGSISVMPSSQDHKRLKDGDEGPNTGGMGAYAPAPVCPAEKTQEYAELTILPIIKKMKENGTPYIGVLYAGLMLTKNGVKTLEYNCRFGDPETQALMALFDGDLAETFLACAEGDLNRALPEWKDGSAVTVVMANSGYPDGKINPTELKRESLKDEDGVKVIHCGTKEKDGKLYASGGRVLAVTARKNTLQEALEAVYKKISKIDFPGVQYRKDIGKRGL